LILKPAAVRAAGKQAIWPAGTVVERCCDLVTRGL